MEPNPFKQALEQLSKQAQNYRYAGAVENLAKLKEALKESQKKTAG
jgi:hypothetical protein